MAAEITTQTPDLDYIEKSNYYNPEAFEELVANRRSCRVYTDEKIPESVMNKCLDLALLAPNSSNMQPWEFYWVRSEEKRKKLNQYCMNQSTATTAAEIVVAVARRDTWKKSSEMMLETFNSQKEIKVPKSAIYYYSRLAPLAYRLGFLGWFGFAKRLALNFMSINKPMIRQPKSISDMRVWSNKSTALACQNLMLAFRSHGYDTCPMEGLDQRRVRKLLNLPYGKSEVCMAVSIGKRAQNGIYGPRIRFNRDLYVKEV